MVRKVVWWSMSAASVILSIFFLFMGIQLCLASYRLDHPHQFILTFFASNLIILISIAILAGVVVRIIARLRQGPAPPDEERPQLARDSHDQPNT
jgi:cytochrome b561